MNRNFKEAIKYRRSVYEINNKVTVPEKDIKEIMEYALQNVPSSFNSQSTRMVLLLNDHHIKLWNIVKDELRKIVPAENFGDTEGKIDGCFMAGYGTILFFEDQAVIKGLENGFPSYADKFYNWGVQTSGMHQFAVWTMLQDAGLGSSLQHYNPLIDVAVAKEWNISKDWELVAQMPFGTPINMPEGKEKKPLSETMRVFE